VSGAVLVVHGGAGSVQRGAPEEPAMREALRAALEDGRARLAEGASALDVVEATLRRLEADALFNAGRGSVLNSAGEVEMDACVIDGATRRAGAVCVVRRLAHPVSAARLVLEKSRHVLLAGAGAESFALEAGATAVEPASLVTEQRREQLERARRRATPGFDHDAGGTVGAVARDAQGHLAAATSTGGLVNKLPGRVSDSALVGSGTWADDATCAVSTTGHGESMICAAVAHEVDARLRLTDESLDRACAEALARQAELGGRGGLIALDREGRFATPFTTPAMVRGWIAATGAARVEIFPD
jgi:beta-aspartyl-peptidase (threonine type)